MSYPKTNIAVRFIAPALVLTCALAAQAAPGDEKWDDRFYVKSLNGASSCAAIGPHGDIYVGGGFLTADDVIVNYVARWDGNAWHSLRGGLNNSVMALVFDSHGNLYVGGTFTDAGGDPDADRIAVWDGSDWSSIGGAGSGLGSAVKAIAFDASGHLVAGGDFTDAGGDPDADRIAVWNGSQWSSIGGPGSGLGGSVNSIALSSGGILVAGGNFTDAGGSATADHIAGWNGSSWNSIGGGLNNTVFALTFAANGDLYVGGSFTDAGGDADADRIAIWSSPSWRSVGGAGSGLGWWVRSIVFSDTGRLYVGGNFTDAGGDPDADGIARWTPTGWISMGGAGSGLGVNVFALVIDDDGKLVATGWFEDAGGDHDADNVARWEIGGWVPLSSAALPTGSGLKGSAVYALARDGAGRLYAGGDFGDAGGDPAGDYIAVWDGSEWRPLGGPDSPLDGYVYALAVNDAGQLVVGGDFFTAGGDPDANYIALWDGVSWSSLGGPGSDLDDKVNVLVIGADGRLYAGGAFEDAGGDLDADYVAVWDGAAWGALVGPGGVPDGEIFELVFDAAGNLYAGGDFSDAGGDPDADYVAVWNGTAWTSIGGPGSGLDSYVYALAVDALGRLFVGGEFTDAGGDPDVNYIVTWDGGSWIMLGAGLNDVVRDLAVDGGGNLYAIGEFRPDTNDPLQPRGIAVWDGASWESLGKGLEDYGYALFYDGGRNVYAGGEFDWAGNKPSSKIGCYTGATPAGILFFDGFESGDTSAWNE